MVRVKSPRGTGRAATGLLISAYRVGTLFEGKRCGHGNTFFWERVIGDRGWNECRVRGGRRYVVAAVVRLCGCLWRSPAYEKEGAAGTCRRKAGSQDKEVSRRLTTVSTTRQGRGRTWQRRSHTEQTSSDRTHDFRLSIDNATRLGAAAGAQPSPLSLIAKYTHRTLAAALLASVPSSARKVAPIKALLALPFPTTVRETPRRRRSPVGCRCARRTVTPFVRPFLVLCMLFHRNS